MISKILESSAVLVLGLSLSACAGSAPSSTVPASPASAAATTSGASTSTGASPSTSVSPASAGATVLDPATTMCADSEIQALAAKYKLAGFNPGKISAYITFGLDNAYLACTLGYYSVYQSVLPVTKAAFKAESAFHKTIKLADGAYLGGGGRNSGVRVKDRSASFGLGFPGDKLSSAAHLAILTRLAKLLPAAPQPPTQITDPHCEAIRSQVADILGGAPVVVNEAQRTTQPMFTACSYLRGESHVEVSVVPEEKPSSRLPTEGATAVQGIGSKATWEPAKNSQGYYRRASTLTVAYEANLTTVNLVKPKVTDVKAAAIALARTAEPLAK